MTGWIKVATMRVERPWITETVGISKGLLMMDEWRMSILIVGSNPNIMDHSGVSHGII